MLVFLAETGGQSEGQGFLVLLFFLGLVFPGEIAAGEGGGGIMEGVGHGCGGLREGELGIMMVRYKEKGEVVQFG